MSALLPLPRALEVLQTEDAVPAEVQAAMCALEEHLGLAPWVR